jgi:hypothetical protein
LPNDGFFGWCVVTGTGQPFLSQADYFRAAVDVGHGDWSCIREIAKWLTNTVTLLQQAPCLPNADSLGWSERFSEKQWQAWRNLAAVSGMALEVSGDLRKLDAGRLGKLNRALELSRPESRLRILDMPTAEIGDPPGIWFSQNSRRGDLLGLFNWGEENAEFPLGELGLASEWADAWTGEEAGKEALALAPGDSRLLARRHSV